MNYADEAAVLAALKIVPERDDYAERLATIQALNEQVSRSIDEKCGRTFGGGVIAPTVREVGVRASSDVLVLPWGAISITSISTGGTWDGSGWTRETVLPLSAWRPWQQDAEGRLWALRRVGGTWDGEYRLTGVWADNPGGTVPEEIIALATQLVINQDLLHRTSAAGLEGPEENGIRPLNLWALETTKATIRHYLVPRMVV